MQKAHSGELKIPLDVFFKANGYGLLEMCNELPEWYLFLGYIAHFFETESFVVRGSCIAQAVLFFLSEIPEGLVMNENGEEAADMSMVLVPYTEVSAYLKSIEYLRQRIEAFTEEEKLFFTHILKGVSKKNIDLYMSVTDISDIEFYANQFAKSFSRFDKANIVNVTIFPNGVAVLEVEIKGGYVDQSFHIVLKPQVKQDLRKNLSKRQLASKGVLSKVNKEWALQISKEDMESLLSNESFSFLGLGLGLGELLLQSARTLRFNSIYKVGGVELITREQLLKVAEELILAKTTDKREENYEYMLSQSMNEFMLAFLHDPELFISFVLSLPLSFFPNLNRNTLQKNKGKIIELLSKRPEYLSVNNKNDELDLSLVLALLLGDETEPFEDLEAVRKYGPIVDSIDAKIGLTSMLEQLDTHSTWYFKKYTNYYLFVTLFHPFFK